MFAGLWNRVIFPSIEYARLSVTLTVAASFLYTRSPHVLWCVVGGGGAALIARIMKHVIRQPRPQPIVVEETSKVDSTPQGRIAKREAVARVFTSRKHGMPSSHTLMTTYFATYLLLSLKSPTFPANGILKALLAAGLVTYTGLVGWSRVSLRRHTPIQVFVGLIVGLALGATWRGLWGEDARTLVLEWFGWLCKY